MLQWIAFGKDLSLAPLHLVQRRDVTDRAVKPSILQRQGDSRPNALGLDGFVPAFDFPIRLRIIRRSSHMSHAADANEFFEIFRDKLGAVVGDDAARCVRRSTRIQVDD